MKSSIITQAQSQSIDKSLQYFRMNIDRSFSKKGFGTIVAGTVDQGKAKIDFFTFGLFVTLSLLIALIFALIAIMPWLRAPRLQSKPIDNQLLDINVAVRNTYLVIKM